MVNKAVVVGRLTADPKTNSTATSFSVATSESWKDKSTGEKKEKTEYHRVVTFGKLAEICGNYLVKGKLVYIEGKLQTRSYEQDNITKYTTEIVCREMKMLSGNDSSPSGNNFDNDVPF